MMSENLMLKKLENVSPSQFLLNTKQTSQKYFRDYFSGVQLAWSDIYSLSPFVPIDSELRCFQYKI